MSSLPVHDIHVHIQPWEQLKPGVAEAMMKGREDGEAIRKFIREPAAFAAWLRDQGVARVGLINYPSQDVMGFDHEVNRFAARYRDHDPGLFLAFGGVHPRFCRGDGKDEIGTALDELALDGIKIHPPHQLLHCNDHVRGDRVLAGLYERCQEKGVPVMIHTGTSVFPGARGKFGDPMDADDVAVDFPDLRIILAHCGRPLWGETVFHLLRRHPNVYGDISGIPPRRLLEHFPRAEEVAGKLLFGTDWPSPGVRSIRANVEAFLDLPLSAEAKERILWRNALSVFPPRT